jgi:hypothetical protein
VRKLVGILFALCLADLCVAADAPGKDHVGLPLPEYTTGEECLFCHRNDVGPSWLQTSHAWTTRPADQPPTVEKLPREATHVIGGINAYMALKQMGYGRFALYSAKSNTWQTGVFEQQCAGCHTTAVDPKSLTFATSGLDCVTCHGLVPTEHTTNGALAWLGKKHAGTPRLKEAICAQCHLRGGKSLSTGRPYPNNFFAGDDLFLDFRLDLTRTAGLDKNDTHSYVKTRAVMEGKSERTCMDCHKIHVPPANRRRDPTLQSTVCGY